MPMLVRAPLVAGQHPHQFELVAVGIGAVDALGGAVAGFAGVGAGVEQGLAGGGELVDGVELPGQVVEADATASLGSAGGADAEQAEVVVVARAGSRRNAALARGSRATISMPNTSV